MYFGAFALALVLCACTGATKNTTDLRSGFLDFFERTVERGARAHANAHAHTKTHTHVHNLTYVLTMYTIL